MAFGLKLLASALRRFRTADDGGPSVEFVLVFVPFIMLPVAGFEMGLLMTRHAMLERGVDIAIRELRLSTGENIGYDDLRNMICNGAGILPDCTTNVRLEMRTVDLFDAASSGGNNIPSVATCTKVDEPFVLANETFDTGVANEVMVVRACGVFNPILPTFGLGSFLSNFTDGKYRLVSTTAFVMEPA